MISNSSDRLRFYQGFNPDEFKIRNSGFDYPPAFDKLITLGLVQLEPWWVMKKSHAAAIMRQTSSLYPKRRLIPFAQRDDCDDMACFEYGFGGQVQLIHSWASEGWEQRKTYPDL